MPILLLKHFKSNEEKLEAYRAEVDVDDWPQSVKDLLIDDHEVNEWIDEDVDCLLEDLPVLHRQYSNRMKTPFDRIMYNFRRPFDFNDYVRIQSEAIQIYNEHANEMKFYYEDFIKEIETLKKIVQIITGEHENRKIKTWEKKVKSLKNKMYEEINTKLFNASM